MILKYEYEICISVLRLFISSIVQHVVATVLFMNSEDFQKTIKKSWAADLLFSGPVRPIKL